MLRGGEIKGGRRRAEREGRMWEGRKGGKEGGGFLGLK